MEKRKRWQFFLILAVILLTIYNILPTLFYYSKPLNQPITAKEAHETALSIVARVNELEVDAKEWLTSFSQLIRVKPISIELKEKDPQKIELTFQNVKDADLFKRFLPQAGGLIPFVPSRLELDPLSNQDRSDRVVVSRQIGVHLNPSDADQLFHYASKFTPEGKVTDFYRNLVWDRVTQLSLAFGGTSHPAQIIENLGKDSDQEEGDIIALSKQLIEIEKALPIGDPITSRYFASFAQGNQDADSLIQKFLNRSDSLKSRLATQIENLLQEQKKLKEKDQFLDSQQLQLLSLLQNQRETIETANAIIRRHIADFKVAKKPLNETEIHQSLVQSEKAQTHLKQTVSLEGRNPFIQALIIDWENDRVIAKFYEDVQNIRLHEKSTETGALLKEKLNQFIINDIAYASSQSDETLAPFEDSFAISLNKLTNSTGVLAFDLGYLAKMRSDQLYQQLINNWTPHHSDLSRSNYPIESYAEFKKLKPEEQSLGLVIYAPAMYSEEPLEGFRSGSIYVIARGMDAIMHKYQANSDLPENKALLADVNQLSSFLQQNGFIGYSGHHFGLASEFNKDYIFELDDYYSTLLMATREDFSVHGNKRFAVLDFTDVEQRILAWNKIEDRMQEDLLKWKEAYVTAQIDLNASSRYLVPRPTQNVYWENFKLSFLKYFKGDERKVLKWGLDLSGGKTVRIGLRDQNGREVTNPDDLKQAVNELYNRINKMGVSERTIVIEGKNIILDFPGSQNLSAAELVKASAMYFHIVNEKFTKNNTALKDTVNHFLQNVWNEAVVTNRKDIDSINEIAWQHLGADEGGNETRPRSDYAKILYEQGLRLANPKDRIASSAFDETLSSIGIMSLDNPSDWETAAHPLIVVFHNYALEGSSLTSVQAGYDPSKGNILSFSVKSSFEGSEKARGNPRNDLYAWTSQFAEDKILGTPKEAFTHGNGWRMAVILNGSIISKPSLNSALSDGGMISGRFSQREINQLASDLKAGSLSFTPRILSEQNVSPELGHEERMRGIIASITALILVVIAMVSYYRFAGVIASAAVLFNILILWGVLQNLGAAITLPGIAGIVLAIGMAVDANVLVFERIREEFKISGRIASAIQAGYKKAFSAIFDSNITTLIAAFILIHFDSGPVKGFAVTLIIGILSSMFTALFMTRYFFAGWVQNPKNKLLKMSQFIGNTHFNFLKQSRKAIAISLVVMVLGSLLFASQFKTLFGMDFTGGYSLIVNLEEQPGQPNYRLETANALMAHGATSNDVQIRELSRPNQLRIQLGMGMEEKGHPFYQLPENMSEDRYAYEYQKNPRINWVVKSLEDAGLKIQPSQLGALDRDWTVMSGQFSDAMRWNAIMGLGLALLCILIYITFRFEFKFAIGAVVGLVHDVIITLGILAFFHKLGFPVQIDLQVVGAIMTIIGYSLNDTIIVFDRIREDMKLMRKMKFHEICNHALNVTLSRTIMTSGTTLLVLLALVLLGGKTIFAFSLVMTIGVIVGTLSSLYIATPVLIYFHDREERKAEERLRLSN
jgi:SecD/SecF fusion protein